MNMCVPLCPTLGQPTTSVPEIALDPVWNNNKRCCFFFKMLTKNIKKEEFKTKGHLQLCTAFLKLNLWLRSACVELLIYKGGQLIL